MPRILLETHINAQVDVCFDIARSVDVHLASAGHTGERAVAGRTSGLMNLHDTVTWRARHLGVWQNLTSKISEMKAPEYFTDEMTKGAFKSFRHEHHFTKSDDGGTLMKDIFEFEAPYGVAGMVVNRLFLTAYMRRFLEERNRCIKEYAESGTWG
jgi:ligand-binding SRPBCC domain-containing protein